MHIGHSFPTSYCMMDGARRTVLETVREEVDLGVIVRSDLISTSQCNKAAAAARKIIGMVRRNFRKLDVEDFLLIYKTYIRPRLEFCIQSWSLVSISEQRYRNARKSPEDSDKISITAQEVQLRRETTEIGTNNTKRQEATW